MIKDDSATASLLDLKAQHWRGTPSPELPEKWEPGQPKTFYVFADERRNYSGVFLAKDHLYRFSFKEIHDWNDASISAHPICGWGTGPFSWWQQLARALGRTWSASPKHDLMVLLGYIEGSSSRFAFADYLNTDDPKSLVTQGTFQAPDSGELVAFANDAKLDVFYKNNSGYLMMMIEPLSPASNPSSPL